MGPLLRTLCRHLDWDTGFHDSGCLPVIVEVESEERPLRYEGPPLERYQYHVITNLVTRVLQAPSGEDSTWTVHWPRRWEPREV